jgi:hypothetical protein
MTYTSSRPIEAKELRRPKSLPEAVDALKRARAIQQRKFYERPIPAHAKAVMRRMMGETED